MSIAGGCLCGSITFQVSDFVGPFELCHCSRCRHAFGAAFAAMIGVDRAHFEWISGSELVQKYEAPIRAFPPGYQTAFCPNCGSPAPSIPSDADWFEIPVGLLGPDFDEAPDRHIYTDFACAWNTPSNDIPRLTQRELIQMRLRALK